MFIVGIDIAKRSHIVRVIDSEGRTVCKPFSIRNSCSGYNTLLERLRKLTNHKSEFLFATESTAHYWLPSTPVCGKRDTRWWYSIPSRRMPCGRC